MVGVHRIANKVGFFFKKPSGAKCRNCRIPLTGTLFKTHINTKVYCVEMYIFFYQVHSHSSARVVARQVYRFETNPPSKLVWIRQNDMDGKMISQTPATTHFCSCTRSVFTGKLLKNLGPTDEYPWPRALDTNSPQCTECAPVQLTTTQHI